MPVAPALFLSLCSVLALAACKSEKSDDYASAASAEPLSAGEQAGNAGHAGHEGKRQLAPAAFDACQGKGVGDACTATFGEKQIEAKCAAVPDGRLACRPDREKHEKPE